MGDVDVALGTVLFPGNFTAFIRAAAVVMWLGVGKIGAVRRGGSSKSWAYLSTMCIYADLNTYIILSALRAQV